MIAARVDERTHAAVGRARDDGVAGVQRTAVDEHRRNRATALVEVRLDDVAGCLGIGVRLELEHVGLQKDGLEQVVDVELLLRGNLDEHVLAAPLFGDDAMFDELLADAVGIRAGLVDLVHRDDDGHIGSLGMVDCLDGLRHDAVISGDDEHNDVGHLSTAGTHGGKSLVAGRVDEGDLATVDVHDGCTDVLGDAARFTCGNASMADSVEQRGLAVIDVTHDGNDRRTRLQVFLGVVVDDGVLLLGRDHTNLAAHVVGDELDEVIGHGLGERQHLTEHKQALDDVVGLHAEQLGELGDVGTLGNLHDGVVEHERGIKTLLDGLHLHALASLCLALLLALLAAALTLMRVRGGYSGARLGKHLVALELLRLYGHLGIAILALGLVLELGNDLHDVAALALLAATLALLATALGALGLGLVGLLGLLRLDALLLRLNLGKQRAEVGRFLGREHGSRTLVLRRRLGRLPPAGAKRFLDRLLLGDFGRHLRSAGLGASLGLLARDALLLRLDLACKALEAAAHGRLLRRMLRLLGASLALVCTALATSALGFAKRALLLNGRAAVGLFFGLLALFLRLLLSKLLCFLRIDLASALLDFRRQVLSNLIDVGIGKHARMAFRRYLHLVQPVEQFLARHIEFFRQFMYSHAGHVPLLLFSSDATARVARHLAGDAL